MSWRKISRTSMDRSAFQFSHGSIEEFFLLTIYFLYMCLLREANITVSQSSSSIPISCLLARCINDVKTSFKLNWWINIGFYGLRSNSLNAKICSVLFMLNKQNERREWAGEGGYLKGGGGIGVSHQVVTKGKSKSGCGGNNQFRYFVICFQVPW